MKRANRPRHAGDLDFMPDRAWWLRHPGADRVRVVDPDGGTIYVERPRAAIVVRSTLQLGQAVGVDPRPTRRYTRRRGPALPTYELVARLKATGAAVARRADRAAAAEDRREKHRMAALDGGGAAERARRTRVR